MSFKFQFGEAWSFVSGDKPTKTLQPAW